MESTVATDHGPELPLLLAGFRRGMTAGAVGGLLVYAAVLLRMKPEEAGPLLGVAAGGLAAMVGGAFLGGLLVAYLRVARAPRG
jgi:hypothetical protein